MEPGHSKNPSRASPKGKAVKTAENHVNLQPHQVEALKSQMMAYNLLSKNVPVPPALQGQVFTNLAPSEADKSQKLQQAMHNPNLQGKIAQGTFLIKEKVFPATQQYLKLNNAPSTLLNHYRMIIPSQTPKGFDPITITKFRENMITSRIEYRIKELEELPNNIPEEEKIKALIELKSLRLLHVQRRLRYELVQGTEKALTYETELERSAYRRIKKLSLKDTRMAERLERQGRMDREKRDKVSQSSYMVRVTQHHRDMTNFHRNHLAKVQKLNKAILSYHSSLEKEEAKRQEKMAKERIKALKADDEEAYLKLVDQEKDTRITHLLRQTDSYLDSLTNLVALQQQEAAKYDSVQPSAAITSSEDLETRKQNDYYATAHKVQEEISQQSSLLVGGTLKEYQLKGLEWMISLYNNNLNGILADEMGLGKTIQTISLVTYLMEKKRQNGPYLIIVPLSTMTNWSLEFQKWAPSVVKVDYKGTPQARKLLQYELKKSNFNVLLSTYEYIIKDRPFLSRFKWLYMIIDEGHRMKNSQSKLSTILTQYYSCKYRLILTGTPLQNNLPELWSLLNFVLPKIFNSSQSFDEWFNTPFANTGEKIELNEEETLLVIKRLHKVLRPFLLRRLKKDVESELPDKIERIIKCRMSALQKSLHEMLKRKGAGGAAAGGMKRLNNTIMQLRKICNHPFVFEEVERQINPSKENNSFLWRVAGKFELLRRILPKFKASNHKVLMFFQMTQIMTIMEDFLTMLGIQYLRLDGSTKADDRTDLLKKFNGAESQIDVFLLSTRAGGLGLNLQTADTVIIFDSDWNPHQDLQAQDRAHRIGQTKEVRIFRLVTSDSVEEVILARAQYKLSLDGKVIQAGKFDQKSTNEEREALLRALMDNEKENDDDDEVFDNDEINDIIARDDNELQLFKRIDAERQCEDEDRWVRSFPKGTAIPPLPPQLIDFNEIPKIYLHDENNEVLEIEDPMQFTRKRKQVVYDDGLTEEQWLETLDEDTEKSSKKTKKPKDDNDSVFEAESRNIDLKRKFLEIVDAVENLTDDDGRVLSELFLELPDAEMYPDYYMKIKKPIALSIIKDRVNEEHYTSISEFSSDMMLMFSNAFKYNVKGSLVYEDAQTMKHTFQELIDDLENEIDSEKTLKIHLKLKK